jgi:hypothetical protein
MDLDDLNFDEYQLPGEGKAQKKDRKPIEKIAVGFAEGARAQVTSKSFIKRAISDAMPKGYGTAINAADSAVQGVRELYNSAAQDLRPLLPVARKAVEKVTPKVRSFLPDSTIKRLEAFAKNKPGYRAPTQGEIDAGQISAELAGIFRVQMEESARQHATNQSAEMIRQDIVDKRERKSAFHFSAMRHGIDRLVAYQDQVNARYQQKSLEFQMRSFFTLRDIRNQGADMSVKMAAQLDAIVKNTALPDAVKVKQSEQYGSTLRDKLYGRSQQAIVDYVGKFGSKLQANLKTSLKAALSGVHMGAMGAESAMDMGSMMGDMGMSGHQLAGHLAGDFAASHLGRKAGRWARGKVEKVPGAQSFGARLAYLLDTLPEQANKWARSDRGDYGKLGSFVRFFKNVTPRMSQDTKVGEAPINNADEAVGFNNQARRSLTEVIPGFLSRIHNELQILRTGDASIKPTVFNMDKGEFTSKSAAANDAKNRLFSKSSLDMTHYGLKQVMSQIDPQGKLSDGTRKALQKQLLSDTAQGKAFDPDRFIHGDDVSQLSDTHKKELGKHFQNHFMVGGKTDWVKTQRTSDAFRSMQSYVGDPTQIIRAYMQTGNRELLDELGLITRNGSNDHVNFDKVLEIMAGHDPSMPSGSAGPSPGGAGPSGPGPAMRPGGFNWAGLGKTVKNAASTAATSSRSFGEDLLAKAAGPLGKARAILSNKGEFISAKTGEAITSLSQIAEGVVDKAGKVVLSATEAAKVIADHDRMVSGAGGASKLMGGFAPTEPKYSAEGGGGAYSELLKLVAEGDAHRTEESKEQLEALHQLIAIAASGAGGEGLTGDAGKLTRFGLFGRWGGKLAGGVMGAGRMGLKGLGAYFKGTYGAIGSVIGGGARLAGGVARGLTNFVSDIMVKGESEPALYAKGMKNGAYKDQATGKVIRKIGDIKGPVVDADGNVVLSQTDYEKGVYYKRGGHLVKLALGSAWKGLKMFGSYYGTMVSLPFKALGLVGKGLGALRDYAQRARDVYVVGEMNEPKLYATLMEAGAYYDRRSRKQIRRPKDIRGEVVELTKGKDEVIRLTMEDLKKGICDVRGKPFKSILGKLFGAVGGTIGLAGSLLRGSMRATGAVLGFGMDAVTGIFKRLGGIFNPKVFEVYSTKSTTLLEKIFQVLDARLPAAEHIRSGSWQDQQRKKGAKGNPAGATPAAAASSGGLWSWLKNKFGKHDDDEEKDEDGNSIDIETGGKRAARGTFGRNAKAWMKNAGRKLSRSKLGRLLGKGWNKLGGSRVGKLVGRLANSRAGALVGRGASGLARAGGGILRAGGGLVRGGAALLGVGEMGGALSAVGGGIATAAGGVASAAGAVGSGIATAAGAIGSVISAPVVLGAAAVAAVGYGIYKGVQYYNLKKSQPLRKVRMAQYGVDINQNVWPMKKVLELEDMLKDHVSVGPTGGSIDMKGFDPAELPKIFGIDASWYNPFHWGHSDEGDGQNHIALLRWFNQRFKPVFITWMAAKQNMAGKVDLADLDDKLDAATKQKMIAAAQAVDASIYGLMDSPFGDDPLTATADTVNDAFKEVKGILDAEAKKDDKSKGKDGITPATAGALAVAGAKKLPGMAKTDLGQAAGEVNLGEADKSRHVAAALAAASTASGLTAKGTAGPKAVMLSSTLSSLLVIRLKTYGLVNLQVDRVKALYGMEADLLPTLTYDTNGLATFDDKPDELFTKYAGSFGISPSDPKMRASWIEWFSERFVPVMLQFASAVKKANKNVDPGDAENYLTGAQLLDVANAVIATTGKVKDVAVSVWTATVSPFDDQPLNADSKAVEANLLALKTAIKQQTYNEQTAKLDAANGKINGANGKPMASASAGGASASAGGAASSAAAFRVSPNQVKASTNLVADANDVSGTASDGSPIGKIIPQPGNGTGGDINNIPLPAQGSKGWDSMKATIVAAAKMAGVDPGMMATFASIESGFNPTAKPPKGSAKGLFQFTNETWQGMLAKYGQKYGIDPNTSPFDPRANALMGAEFLKQNRDYLKRRIGRDPTDTELYAAHFLGAGGAVQMLTAGGNAIAAQINPAAAGNNGSIFYSSNGSPRTRDELMAVLDKKVRGNAKFDAGMSSAELAAAKKAAPAATGGAGATPAPASAKTGDPLSDLPTGPGAGSVAAKGASDQATTSATYASNPAPDMNKSSGLALSAPTTSVVKASSNQDDYVAAQRQTVAQQGAAADARSKQVSADNNAQLNTISDLMSQQVKLLGQLVDASQQQVALLGGIHGNTASSDSSGADVAAASIPAPTRGNRPLVEKAAQAPISVKRGIAQT